MTQREIVRKRIRVSIIIAVVILLAAYAIFQARNLALGPVISVTEPADGAISSSTVMTISGTAKNIAFMTLDGRQIFTDEAGNWSEDIVLAPGHDVVTLYARDKFGKETTKTLELTQQ
jgi:hypothetical protein